MIEEEVEAGIHVHLTLVESHTHWEHIALSLQHFLGLLGLFLKLRECTYTLSTLKEAAVERTELRTASPYSQDAGDGVGGEQQT